MIKHKRILLSTLLFNTVTAIAGGLGLIAGLIKPPLDLLDATPFSSYAAPGWILLLAVGGSSLVATVAFIKKVRWNVAYALASGWIMFGWIVGEIILIHQLSWLQVLYLGTAVVVLWFAKPVRLDKLPTKQEL